MGLQCVQDLAYASQFLFADFAGLVKEYDVAELYLLDNEVGDVVFGKCLACKVQAAVKLVLKPDCIHDGADAVEFDVLAVGGCVGELPVAAYGLGNGCRLADAACLDYDVVEAACLVYVLELLDEVHLQVAADTAVLQCYQRVVLLVDDAALLYEIGIDVDLAYIVYDNSEFYSLVIVEYAVEQGCLSAAQIACDE